MYVYIFHIYYMKKCNKCKIEKLLIEFHKDKTSKDGHSRKCKDCRKNYNKVNKKRKKEYDSIYRLIHQDKLNVYQKEYYSENKDKINKKHKEYREDNSEKICEKNKEYRKLNDNKIKEYREKNKDKIRVYNKEYRENNKEKIFEYRENNKEKINENRRNRYKTETLFRLGINIRASISYSIRNNGYNKKSKTNEILGCSFDELLEHLNKNEYYFEFGEENLDIDHIIPLSSITNEKELYELNHYTNLQLLPSEYNRYIKRDNEWDSKDFENWLRMNETR